MKSPQRSTVEADVRLVCVPEPAPSKTPAVMKATQAGEPEPELVFAAVEYGAQCPGDLGSGREAHVQVLAQVAEESPGAFARRVGRRLAALSGRPLPKRVTAVLSIALSVDATQIAARCSVSRALARCFAQSDGVLLLTGGDDTSSDERAHMMALAQGLREDVHGRNVVVSFASRLPSASLGRFERFPWNDGATGLDRGPARIGGVS